MTNKSEDYSWERDNARRFLLHQLSPTDADRMEVAYFSIPQITHFIDLTEESIFKDYIENRLNEKDRLVVDAYLEVPVIRKTFDEVKRKLEAGEPVGIIDSFPQRKCRERTLFVTRNTTWHRHKTAPKP